MKIPLDLIDGIQIARPCPASWEQMVGIDRIRHCSICAQNVYDLSAMTADEVREFLGARDEDVCVRLYRRLDGTVMTRDCPKGIGSQIRAFVSRAAVAVLGMFGIFSLWGCGDFTGGTEKKGRHDMGKLCPPPRVKPQAVPPVANGNQGPFQKAGSREGEAPAEPIFPSADSSEGALPFPSGTDSQNSLFPE